MRTHSSFVLPVTNLSWRIGWSDADDGAYFKSRDIVGPLEGDVGRNETVFPEVNTIRCV